MLELTINELQAAMTSGSCDARWLVQTYLDRVALLDRAGPKLNSLIELNPDALSIAEQLDQERRSGRVRGPLHGIPVVIKDNIDTADRMMTTAGSLALSGSIAPRDAHIVERLREAGAVILAKANLSEWANFRSTHSSSGWSSRGGQTRNPYALDRSPSGSSSGSAVAVAANLCAASVGTETTGSIIAPASRNSLVGIKPTVGLVSRCGIIPISHTRDTAGPMTRCVEDAALLLDAMTGTDPEDPATLLPQEGHPATSQLNPDGLKGARIGVARNLFGGDPRVDRIIEEAIEAMRHLGAEIVDSVDVDVTPELRETARLVMPFEFKETLNRYLQGTAESVRVRSLTELIAFNIENSDLTMPFFGQERLIESESMGPLTSEEYLSALSTSQRLARAAIDSPLEGQRLDAIVAPSNGPAGLIDLVNGDSRSNAPDPILPAAVAGYPHVTVPAGYVRGLPVGISFLGTAFSEARLLRLAYAFEQGTRIRRPPAFAGTAEL